MTEITLASAIAELIKNYGTVGGIVGFIAFLVWQDRRRTQREDEETKRKVAKEDADRLERKHNTDADRLLLTNHLSTIISEDSKSRTDLAASLATLAESIGNFHNNCRSIQKDFKDEVDRLKKG